MINEKYHRSHSLPSGFEKIVDFGNSALQQPGLSMIANVSRKMQAGRGIKQLGACRIETHLAKVKNTKNR
jgi:hypothetical protein